MGLDGKPVDMYIRPDVGTFNKIIIITPPGAPGNSPIKIPGTGEGGYAPGDPFVITGVSSTGKQYGTSCANPAQWYVTAEYTGDPTGKTISIYTNNSSRGFTLYDSGLSPLTTHVVNQEAYFNKPNSLRTIGFRITDDSDALNTADSAEEWSIEGVDCGA
jgi:hypothetical protein